jgi:hypothetical protein
MRGAEHLSRSDLAAERARVKRNNKNKNKNAVRDISPGATLAAERARVTIFFTHMLCNWMQTNVWVLSIYD